MLKRAPLLISLILVLTFTGTTLAQEPVLPHDSDPTWQVSYWNNQTLSGEPVLQREETNLDHDWGTGSPHSSVNADGFSARWTRYIYVEEGEYRFTATSDDGMRVYVDDELIINEWHDHPAKTVNAKKSLRTGHHWVVVEYYENHDQAIAKFSYKPTSTATQDWQGEYFNNTTLDGTPALTRKDAQINFNWGAGEPAPGIGADEFSVRWTRTMNLPAGYYRFEMTVDDGGRLWVKDRLLIDAWQEQTAQTYSAEIYLPGDEVPLKMEYYEQSGNAVAQLSWAQLTPTIHDWRAEYFNNTSLSGTPALVRDDAKIDFNWGSGSPALGTISTDQFSARWTRTLDLSAGRYRFKVTVDDGARLWVDGHLLIDAWREQSVRTYTEEIYVSGGSVPIKMEYFEHSGLAIAKLSWSPASTATYSWHAEYFDNMSLSGTPALVRDEAKIDFDWGSGSPVPGTIGADRFSVRWTRTLDLSAGRYRFTMTVDDGARLWVNGQLLIDVWHDQAVRTYTAEIDLPDDPVPVKMEYYEHVGHAVARLSWDSVGGASPAPGTVVVDDTDPGFVQGGSSSGWRTVAEGYGGHLTWTKNNDWPRPYYNWARWYPNLPKGRYEVLVFIPERYTTTASAHYWVSHANGYTSRIVDQSANGSRWISLGTYWFNGTSNEYVSLSDATGESRLTRLIAFDAVKWVPR